MNVDVIIAACAFNFAGRNLFKTCVLTAHAHTKANIIVVANNILPEWREELQWMCNQLGVTWIYQDPFNFPKAFNDQIRAGNSPYYACFGQDVIFYPNWMENLIRCWEKEPDYYYVAPYSFNQWREAPFTSLPVHPQDGIVEMHPHCAAGIVFRRDKQVLYDESMVRGFDSDLHQFVKHHKLREGICLSSRVDHFGQAVLNGVTNEEQDRIFGGSGSEDNLKLWKKWNIT